MKYQVIDKRLNLQGYKLNPATEGANSIDLRACIKAPLIVYPDQTVLIPTGIKVELPENTIGMLLPRSGLGSKGLVLGNLVGNIDPDYRGEVKACVWNRNSEKYMTIEPMDRIAQFVVMPVLDPKLWEQVNELSDTERGEGGFGSTSVK